MPTPHAEVLPKLTGEDLKEMAVATGGHGRKLLEALAASRDGTAVPRAVIAATRATSSDREGRPSWW